MDHPNRIIAHRLRTRVTLVFLAAAVSSLLLVACGDDTEETHADASSVTSSSGASTQVSSATGSSAGNGGTGAGGGQAQGGAGGAGGGTGGSGGTPTCTGPVAVWNKSFGSSGSDRGNGLTTNSTGDAILVGEFSGAVDFGGGPLTDAGFGDVFITKLDGSGNYIASMRFGSSSWDGAEAVAADEQGNLYVAGSFDGTVDFGGTSLTCAGLKDVFVLKLDALGQTLWAHRFGGSSWDKATAIAVDGNGHVVVSGTFEQTVDFDSGPVTSAGGEDAFVVALDSDGNVLFDRHFGGSDDDVPFGLAVDSAGNIAVTGHTTGDVDFGGGPLAAIGGWDTFLAMYDAAGNHLWSKLLGSPANDSGGTAAFDGADRLLVGGSTAGSPFVDVFDVQGASIWSKTFSSQGSLISALATSTDGHIVAGGTAFDTVDLGQGLIGAVGSPVLFVLQLDGLGSTTWTGCYTADANDMIRGIRSTSDGIVLAGSFEETLNLGAGMLVSAGNRDAFIAKLPIP